MKVMYSMFKKAPSKDKLQTIIKNATVMVSDIYEKYQHNEIDLYVDSFFHESMAAPIDKASVDYYFERIIEDIYTLSRIRCSQKTKDKYMELLQAFYIKIRNAYHIENV